MVQRDYASLQKCACAGVDIQCTLCCIVQCRYAEAVIDNEDQLSKEHQQMIRILREVQEKQLLEVYIAWVEQHEICSATARRYGGSGEPVIEDSETKIMTWHRLDDSVSEWIPGEITYKDVMLQVS